jgi:hypothetical protein
MTEICEVDDFLVGDEIKDLFGGEVVSLLQTITSCMYCGIAVGSLKQDGKPFVLWNARATEILGVSYTNSKYEDWPEVYGCKDPITKLPMPSDEIPLTMAMFGKTVKDKVLLIDKGTSVSYINCNALPLLKDGVIVGGVVVFQDVTEHQKQAEKIEELKQKILKLSQVNEQIKSILDTQI